MIKDKEETVRAQEEKSAWLERNCYRYLYGLLAALDSCLDRRLVETFLGLVLVVIMHRHRNQGLVLSELGSYLKGGDQAPAGTKRISRLLHSPRWSAEMIETYLWTQADERVESLTRADQPVLVVWDESVIEKPESLQLEGLCAVRSSKARRLKRIKPGYFNPPGGRPICVPGYHWLQVLVMGMEGPIHMAHTRWWSTRGEQATERREVERQILAEVSRRWGSRALHVWDRGFAGNPWLTVAYVYAVRFVVRWPKHYRLVSAEGLERKAWEMTRGKRSWEHRLIWDARRWNVEMSLRFDKCELAFESPRLHKWETQIRLLLIATLAHAFLLSLLNLPDVILSLLQTWCHRTGKWSLKVKAPLYRLRSALSRLWLAHPPPLLLRLSSG